MLVQTLLISLVTAFAMFDYQLGTLYAFRPIVTCPLIGLILGDLPTGLAIGASLELLFMGNISIGAYLPPDEKVGSILACAFAITLGKGTEAALALAMPIATLSLAISNVINGVMPIIVDKADVCASKGNLKSIYAAHWAIGLIGLAKNVLLVGLAYYLGAGAVQNLLDWIPAFIMDGFGIAANILPAMGFAMLGRLILKREILPFFFLGFLLASYMNVPSLGVALIAIIIGIEKFGLLNFGTNSGSPQLATEGDDDDDF